MDCRSLAGGISWRQERRFATGVEKLWYRYPWICNLLFPLYRYWKENSNLPRLKTLLLPIFIIVSSLYLVTVLWPKFASDRSCPSGTDWFVWLIAQVFLRGTIHTGHQFAGLYGSWGLCGAGVQQRAEHGAVHFLRRRVVDNTNLLVRLSLLENHRHGCGFRILCFACVN